MRILLGLVVSGTLTVIATFGSAAEQNSDGSAYHYCRRENLRYEQTALVCNFGKTENQGCEGWQHSRIDKKDVKEVISAYTQCSDGKWLARIETR